jgi:hypothetical protein
MTDEEDIADMVDRLYPVFDQRNVFNAFIALSVVVSRLLLAVADDKADAKVGVDSFKRRVLNAIDDPNNERWQTESIN